MEKADAQRKKHPSPMTADELVEFFDPTDSIIEGLKLRAEDNHRLAAEEAAHPKVPRSSDLEPGGPRGPTEP